MILGSMPSVTSLEKQEYYGYKHNRFWKIISAYFNQEFTSYEEKKSCIKKNHIILWDVIHTCEREGSLDSAIHHEKCNDVEALLAVHPQIKYVLCNGKKSFHLYEKHFTHLPLQVVCMPSTSNANRSIKEEQLFKEWFQTFDECYKQMKSK